jgi:hypothetical protein
VTLPESNPSSNPTSLGHRPIPESLRAEWLERCRALRDQIDALEDSLLAVGDYEPDECECPACSLGERGHDAYVAAYEAKRRSKERG